MPDTTYLRSLRSSTEELAEALPDLLDHYDRLEDRTRCSVTVGGGMEVFGTMGAITRVQTLILLDSQHPVETADVNRRLHRQLTEDRIATLERELADLRTITPPKYSADWVRTQCRDAYRLDHHRCSICDVMVGYDINGDNVAFNAGCGCSGRDNRRPSSFAEIAEWLQMQGGDEVRDRIMAGLHTRRDIPA